MWKFIKEYFTFSRTELRIILILSGFLLTSLIFRLFLKFIPPEVNEFSPGEIRLIEEFVNSLEFEEKGTKLQSNSRSESEGNYNNLKEFDPNHVTAGELKKMGFPDKIISNISKYRNSGGRFQREDDFSKIYGLPDSVFRIIAPYIKMKDLSIKRANSPDTNSLPDKKRTLINLNLADSAQLVRLKGIGPSFALRIINYRNKLGGFIVPEQVMEVFGMDSSRFELFKESVFVDSSGLRKLDLNKVTFSGLVRHPYIDEQSASAIIKFRQYRGSIKDIEELSLNNVIQKKYLEKIGPYLYISPESEKFKEK